MSRLRAYILPFLSSGSYSSTWVEVTDDISYKGIGSIRESIDTSDFEVGVFKYNRFKITLNNLTGKYSDVSSTNSIFAYKRAGSQFKITWSKGDDITQCGTAICGYSYIAPEVEVFKGLLSDSSLTTDARNQKLTFQILGFESIFETTETPYASISNGQTISTIIYTLLNQSAITDLMTVSAINIDPNNDVAIDDKTDLENTTVKEALDSLLELSNSVLYIRNDIVYVQDFTATASIQKTFYGQASESGIEDIVSITEIRAGLNKLFNFWTWKDTSLVQSDSSSITRYGVKKSEVDISLLTDTTKRNTTLSNLLAEYKDAKQSLKISVPLTYENISLFILDRVAIDYPTVFRAATGDDLPYYGIAIYGTSRYPIGDWAFTIDTTENQKILERQIDIKKELITFKIRKI